MGLAAWASVVTTPGTIVGWGNAGTLPTGNDYVAIATGGYTAAPNYSVALRSDGSLVAWGDGGPPPPGNDYVAIAAGDNHGLALRSDGTIAAWGTDGYGNTTPPAGNDYVAIAAAGYHSLALRSNGTIVAWGLNWFGQATSPPGNDYVAISAGLSHNVALRSDGTIFDWGSNIYGQGSPPAGNDFVAIAAGSWFGLALRSNGSIAGWGYSSAGEPSPPAGNDFVAIAAGYYHGAALRSDGTLAGWGSNYYGERSPPAGEGFVAIAAGGNHSLALWSESDTTAPTITLATPPEGAIYIQNQVVLADYECQDEVGGSGLASCLGDVPDGSAIDTSTLGNHSFTVTASDNAGNTASVGHDYSVVDVTAPTITITTPADGAVYGLNQPVNADFSCEDEVGGSGLASCNGGVPDGSPIDTSGVGNHSFTVRAADNAGNMASLTHTYDVVYTFAGFFAPIDNEPTLNKAKAGQTIAVKWRLTDANGGPISDPGTFTSLTSGSMTCSATAAADAIESYSGSSGLQYLGDGHWQFNWKTPKSYAGKCRVMMLKLADGTTHIAVFQFK
jgi:hypothetical protein